MTTPVSEAPWPGFIGEAPSTFEIGLTKALVLAEPLLFAASMVAFIIATLVLLTRTKAKGRFMFLAGVLVVVGLGVHYWLTFPTIGQTLLQIAASRFFGAFGVILISLGFLRLVWFLSKVRSDA